MHLDRGQGQLSMIEDHSVLGSVLSMIAVFIHGVLC